MKNSNIDWNKRVYEIYIYEAGTNNKVDTIYTQANGKTEDEIKADLLKVFGTTSGYDFYVLASDPKEKKGK